jgi:Ca2+-transporting ATPase
MGAALLVEHPVGGSGYSPLGRIEGLGLLGAQSKALEDVKLVCSLCNDAELFYADGTFQRTGEPTEAACKALAEKLGLAATSAATAAASKDSSATEAAYEALLDADGTNSDPSHYCNRASAAAVAAWTRVATLEFNRDRKTMSVLVCPAVVDREHEYGNNNKKPKKKGARANRLLVKGAPDMLLQRCTHMKLADGKVVSLTPSLRAGLRAKIDAMAQRPLRTLGFAVKEPNQLPLDLATYTGSGKGATNEGGDDDSIDGRDNDSSSSSQEASLPAALKNPSQFATVESGLTWVGLTGIKDPARDEVLDAITECKKAGVRVMMITGDSKPTAMAIARDVGIFTAAQYQEQLEQQLEQRQESDAGAAITEGSLAFTGAEFFQGLSEEEQLEVLSRGQNLVFCRTEPMDKQKLVKMLSYLGEVPAMTGDGVNDAPALQQAAIGVAMGISGTEVSAGVFPCCLDVSGGREGGVVCFSFEKCTSYERRCVKKGRVNRIGKKLVYCSHNYYS